MAHELKLPRLTAIAAITMVAVAVISLTVGKDLYEGRGHSLFSFGLIHFSGYLFFIMMPVEMAFIYYLSWFSESTLIMVAISTAVLAQLVDYVIGIFFSSQFVPRVISVKRILKAESYIERYGALTVFLFNFLPLSSPVISLAAGVLKYKLKNLMFYSIGGLLLKYLLLAIIF
jgi:membrane protein DedA with SNARE-associated domain